MASIPVFPGMTTSIRITSGLVARVWKTAFSASPASPTTSMSGSRLEHLAQAGAHDGVVVDDQDADRLVLGHRSGTSATIVVPAPGLDSSFSLPPSSASRSPMPSRPEPVAAVAAA